MEIQHARETQQLQEQQQKTEQLRKQLVPKAQPVRKYKEFVVKPSDKELTSPHTPRFSERLSSRANRL